MVCKARSSSDARSCSAVDCNELHFTTNITVHCCGPRALEKRPNASTIRCSATPKLNDCTTRDVPHDLSKQLWRTWYLDQPGFLKYLQCFASVRCAGVASYLPFSGARAEDKRLTHIRRGDVSTMPDWTSLSRIISLSMFHRRWITIVL